MSVKQYAIKLYMEGIKQGNATEAVNAYTGARYTQHSTGVADGRDGFLAFFEPFLKRNPVRDIDIVRILHDGPNVFVHAHQSLNNGESKWVTMDMFDSDADGKIVEHWDCIINADNGTTVSGNTVVDGPTEVTDLDQTEQNKARVRLFLTDVLQNGNYAALTDYVSAGSFTQHSSTMASGADVYRAYLESMRPILEFVRLVIGEGNFVSTLSKVTEDGKERASMDLWRLENGMIVEHWDSLEEIAPRDTWANTGKF